ncbi:Shedu immune nuclease family protein [Clostridium tertium]|uniref:Shedu immune nuclease family protein n=1 Tax=Clostridium tertium TaxID=1559 RepID=UPI000DD091D1|nr:Shedu immune nuclease family protein [Clostridium tertium]
MERNTELIPLPWILNHGLHFNVIISKLRLGGGYITDFAYLTKSSDMWELVLIELEDSKKNIFLKNNENIKFSSEFNHAYDQIMEWKSYINDNKQEVLKTVNILKIHLSKNMVKVKYALIIGRNKEKNNCERRKRMFAEKSNNDVKVMTYDSIISTYKNNYYQTNKLILAPWREGFEVKFVPDKLSSSIFAYIAAEHLKIKDEHIEILKKQDYQIDRWLSGSFLNINGKYDDETFSKITINLFSKVNKKINSTD